MVSEGLCDTERSLCKQQQMYKRSQMHIIGAQTEHSAASTNSELKLNSSLL